MMWNIVAGWSGMIVGALMGMGIGMKAERRDWLGGYGSFERQAVRLAHVAFFALGMINVLWGMCGHLFPPPLHLAWVASIGSVLMIVGAFAMPTVCLLSAWKRRCKYLFPLPATCVLLATASQIICVVAHMRAGQ
jgi:hypothetical protein